jgi:glycerate dehydrogenase
MNIVILDGYTTNPGDLSWDDLRDFGDLTVYERTKEEQIIERSRDADILLTNDVALSGQTIRALPRLKYVCIIATGYDQVDIQQARRQQIIVSNCPGYSTYSVSQTAIALLLHLTQHVKDHADAVQEGQWSSCEDACFWNYPLTELHEKTMGIIGLGTIGTRTAVIAEALGMKIISYSPRPKHIPELKKLTWVPLHQVFSNSDVLSLHCPLNAETEGIVHAETLALMKPGAFLINTARGKLVVEQDLAAALNSEKIAGAAVDVLSQEPPRHTHVLLTAKNCYVTPHNAWATKEARSRLIRAAARNIAAFISESPVNVVNQ